MESYACQPYAIRVGAQVLQVHVARRGQLTALATLGTSDIAMTRQMQAGVILPHELDAAGWCRYFPPEIQPLLCLDHSAFLRNSNAVCFARQPTVRCFLLHAWRPGIGIMPHSSALMGRAVSTHSALPGDAIDLPPWASVVTEQGAGRETALSPGPWQTPSPNPPRVCWPDNSPRPPIPPIPPRVGEYPVGEVSRIEPRIPHGRPRPAPVAADLPPWQVPSHPGPQVLAATAMQAICQLRTLSADHAPGPQEPEDLAQALESNQNFPEPTPSGVLPLKLASGAISGEPPEPQGLHPEIDYNALLGCLLPQLRAAESAGAHVLLLVTDSRCFLSIPHFPYFVRHLVARMQWEGPFKERWFPILVNTKEAGLASVHFTWAGPEILAVLRVLAPGVVLMLLDHDTLFTARWEAEELRRFAVLDLLPNTLSTESLGSMEVETDETQPCGSLPASPWSCSPDGSIPCGARSPNSIGMVCASEDQLEANGGLVLFYPNAPDGKHPRPPRFCIPGNVASAVTSIGTALSRALQLVIMPSEVPTPLPGMHEQVPLDQIHYRQCLRNTPLAGTTAHKHSDFVFAWALLGRYIHEVAWKTADLTAGRPEPDIQFGASPVRQVRGVKTWGQGPYEQGFLPLLMGYGGSHSRLAILPGPDLFMANRYAEVIPPPFVHGYGAKGKNILPQWGSVVRLPTLPESVWGNGDTVPLWASVGKKGSGPVRLQLFPGVLMFWKKDALSSCRATPKWRSRPNTPTGPLALLAAAAHAWLAQADLPWPLFAADIKVTPLGLSQYWDDGLAMRVQQALAAFAFPAYQYPPPKPHLTPSGECRSLFISGMNGKAENTPPTVSGSIIHTANSYALTGLEMETVRDNQGKKVRYEDTQRPLLLSTSGNAAHALLLLPQAAQLWARALYPQVEGCGLPAAVRARISSVEASLTMCPALAHLHMPHTAALTALHVGLAAGRAGECKLCVTGFSAGSYTGAAVAIAWHERQKLPDCKGDFVHIKARLGGVAMPRAMLQYILGSELRHAVSLVHHESDQLCIFRPSQAARTQAIGAGARLYHFTGPESLGSGGHSYGHFVHSEELFQLTPGDYVHKELTKKICGLADPRMDRTV